MKHAGIRSRSMIYEKYDHFGNGVARRIVNPGQPSGTDGYKSGLRRAGTGKGYGNKKPCQ